MSERSAGPASQLGTLVKAYGRSWARVRQIILVIGLSAALAAGCWLPAIFETNTALATRVALLLLGLFVASPVVVGVYQLLRLGGVSLTQFENGLIYRRRGQEFVTTWDEIDAYLEGDACRITKKDGQVIEFGLSIEGVDEVAQAIREQTLRRRLPQDKAAILNGSSVQFKGVKPFEKRLPGQALNRFALAYAGFSVDARGITELEGGKRMAWSEVKAYGVSSEKMGRAMVEAFFIEDNQSRFQTRLGLLSNAHILLALCGEMTGLVAEDRR